MTSMECVHSQCMESDSFLRDSRWSGECAVDFPHAMRQVESSVFSALKRSLKIPCSSRPLGRSLISDSTVDSVAIQDMKSMDIRSLINLKLISSLILLSSTALGVWLGHCIAKNDTETGVPSGNAIWQAELLSSAVVGAVLKVAIVLFRGESFSALCQALARGLLKDVVTATLFGLVKSRYHNTWTLERVVASALAGAGASALNGKAFFSGFKMSFLISLFTFANFSMRKSMVAQSLMNPDNIGKKSAGFFSDRIAIGGTRRVPNPHYGFPYFNLFKTMNKYLPCDGPAGGCQGVPIEQFGDTPSRLGSFYYQPGSMLDVVVEAFAGPHDWLSSLVGMYHNDTGNGVFRSGFNDAFYKTLSCILVIGAAPFALAGLIDELPAVHQSLYHA